jgi:hypothetical protein
MRRLYPILGLAALLAPPCLAQTKIEATDILNRPFSVDFTPRSRLDLRVRSGQVHVVGVDQDKISVELSGKNAHAARKLKVRFEKKDGGARMRICGGPRDGIAITVRIPARTDLRTRVPFGEVVVENVSGNQDIRLHAGELTVEVGDREAYSRVDASVVTGEVDASAFGESSGGLFRSFRRAGSDQYRLRARVGAGQLTLRSRSDLSAEASNTARN